MTKEQSVLKYYVLCNRLKDVIRTGWKDWRVERERVESVAEHIYGVQMLALAMHSEYKYDVDIFKVLFMLAIHELEEIIIGDLTLFQITKEEKEELGHEALEKVLKDLLEGETIKELIKEFDARKTKEAIFAYQCDKLECDIQSKLYDQESCVDLNNQDNNKTINNAEVKKLLDEGKSFSDMWLSFGQSKYPYDDNFMAVSNYVMNNKIGESVTKKIKKKKLD